MLFVVGLLLFVVVSFVVVSFVVVYHSCVVVVWWCLVVFGDVRWWMLVDVVNLLAYILACLLGSSFIRSFVVNVLASLIADVNFIDIVHFIVA